MTAREKEFVSQRIIASRLARSARIGDDELRAAVRADIDDIPAADVSRFIVLFRQLRAKITDSMPLVKREVGGLWELDDGKVARFEAAILREHPELDRQALEDLLFWTWYYDDAR